MVTEGSKEMLSNQGTNSYTQQFVLFRPNTDVNAFTLHLNRWYKTFTAGKTHLSFAFQPISEVYLHSDFSGYHSVKGSYRNIYIFSGVALLLLVISCVNFINLSTAKAGERVKETGLRKVLGAARKQLMLQFITESLLLFCIAAILSTVVYQICLPAVERFLGHHLQVTFTSRIYLLLMAYGSMFCISVLTGLYPALILSSFKPAVTLTNRLFSHGRSSQNIIRRSLVVVQFTISIIVLIALIVVKNQANYLNNRDIGYNKNNLLHIDFVQFDGKAQYFKNELLKQTGVVSASITGWGPGQGLGSMSSEINDPDHSGSKLNVWFINADLDFATTMGFHLQRGRLLDHNFGGDAMSMDSIWQAPTKEEYEAKADKQSSLLTAYTARLLHVNELGNPIKQAHTNPVGIIQDFNNESLKDPLQPTIIIADNSLQYGRVLIRILPGYASRVMAAVNELWRRVFPGKLLQIDSVSDLLAAQYKEEARLQQLFSFFGALSMFLAALGIFGLIAQATHQRIREIGIRKVLGASVKSIVGLFSFDFIKLIIVSIIIASPIAYVLMTNWLMDYAYRIEVTMWMFIQAGVAAVIIAFAAMSLQCLKAAMVNPVRSLRSE
jgi:putative ABC transport system permease protein